MTKKFFLIFSFVIAVFFCHSYVFAELTNDISQGVNNAGSEVKNSWDKLGNTMQNAGNNIANSISNMGNENKKTGFIGMNNYNNTNEYTARRTATTTNNNSTVFGMSATMWTWFVFAILGIAIVSLVWYYGMQQNNNSVNKHQD